VRPHGGRDTLLDWAKARLGRFEYGQPANPGPSRTFPMGLPYLLGDKNQRTRLTVGTRFGAYPLELGN